MNGRFLGPVVVLLVAWANLSEAHQPTKTARIGLLLTTASQDSAATYPQALAEYGYVE